MRAAAVMGRRAPLDSSADALVDGELFVECVVALLADFAGRVALVGRLGRADKNHLVDLSAFELGRVALNGDSRGLGLAPLHRVY